MDINQISKGRSKRYNRERIKNEEIEFFKNMGKDIESNKSDKKGGYGGFRYGKSKR